MKRTLLSLAVGSICSFGASAVCMGDSIVDLPDLVITAKGIKYDAKGFNIDVSSYKSAPGQNFLEFMQYIPFVSVEDKKLQVAGNAVYTIYIDGVEIDNEAELTSLPAQSIKDIRIEYLPDVSASSGKKGAVVRITLRKPREYGFNGYILASAGVSPSYGYMGESFSALFKARYGIISVSNYFGYNRQKLLSDYENLFQFKLSDQKFVTNEKYRNWNPLFNDRISLAITPDSKNTVSLALSYLWNSKKGRTVSEKSGLDGMDSDPVISEVYSPDKNNGVHIVGRYDYIGDNGTSVKVSADYMYRYNSLGQNVRASDEEDWTTSDRRKTHLLKGEAAVNAKIGKVDFGVGADFQYTRSSESNDYLQIGKSGSMNVRGYRPGVFVMGKWQYRGLMADVGLRMQGNLIRLADGGSDYFRKNQWQLCPMVSALYVFNEEKGIMANIDYRRAIDELPYHEISTMRKYTSPYSYSVGNRELVSPVSDQVQLMVSLFDKFNFFTGYIHESNPFYYETVAAGDDVVANMAVNGTRYDFGVVGASATFRPFGIWTLKPSVSFTVMGAKFPNFNVSGQTGWKFTLNNSIRISDSMGVSLDLRYEPPSDVLDMKWNAIGSVSGGIYKLFLKNTMRLSLDVNGWQRGRKVTTETAETLTVQHNVTCNTNFNVSLVWWFSGGKRLNIIDGADPLQILFL